MVMVSVTQFHVFLIDVVSLQECNGIYNKSISAERFRNLIASYFYHVYIFTGISVTYIHLQSWNKVDMPQGGEQHSHAKLYRTIETLLYMPRTADPIVSILRSH